MIGCGGGDEKHIPGFVAHAAEQRIAAGIQDLYAAAFKDFHIGQAVQQVFGGEQCIKEAFGVVIPIRPVGGPGKRIDFVLPDGGGGGEMIALFRHQGLTFLEGGAPFARSQVFTGQEGGIKAVILATVEALAAGDGCIG